jgi:hypothetical protein
MTWRAISGGPYAPGSPDAYWRYLHYPFYVAPVGFVISVLNYLHTRHPARLFLPLYAVVGRRRSNLVFASTD